jgi:hypothetical protein
MRRAVRATIRPISASRPACRGWPTDVEPSYAGYSIGKWLDTAGTGRFDTLEVETRNMKGPRTFDGATAIPLHKDNQTIVKERIYVDKADRDAIHNEVTTIDHALTRPWTAIKTYRREKSPVWFGLAPVSWKSQVLGLGYPV